MEMARHRRKKCPNCGQRTIVDDKWSSCQWCHWPLSVKHPPEMEERKSALWPLTWRWAVICAVVVTIIVYVLALFHYSGWKLPDLQQLILGQWRLLLLWLFIWLIIVLVAVGLFYLVVRVTSNRPELLFGALVTIGILLLIAALEGNPISQHIYEWIDESYHIDMLSASITALALALTFGAILISASRTKK